MKKLTLITALLVLGLGLSSCADKKRQVSTGLQSYQNNMDVKKAFKVLSPRELKENFKSLSDRKLIAINKNALEKYFLFQGEYVEQIIQVSWHALKSRVVYFKQEGNEVFMMESQAGHVLSKDIPQRFILASFNILAETPEGLLIIDFNQGMKDLFLAGDWYASDLDVGKGTYTDPQLTSVSVDKSFIDSASFNEEKQRLVIDQLALIKQYNAKDKIMENASYALHYYLSPYQVNEGFESSEAADYKNFAFFEIAPLLDNDLGSKTYSAKHDIRKPIVYAISANTPPEYKETVKEAVLYWNKAFGKEVVQVIDAPADVIAPNPDYNVIQWIVNDQAGVAYADAQMDPLTGEILHAQINMTSVFSSSALEVGKKLIRRLDILKRLKQDHLCHLDRSSMLQKGLAELKRENAPQEVINRAVQAYVRETVSHEVGHTLGLRHNFAGSLSSNLKVEDTDKKVKDYLLTGVVADKNLVPTSSIMDYERFKPSLLTGELIRDPAVKAFDYDLKAIQTLYFNKEYTKKELPLFCTDSQVDDKYLDCNRFDEGSSPFDEAVVDQHYKMNAEPVLLLEKFLLLKRVKKEITLENIEQLLNFPIDQTATDILKKRVHILSAFSKEASFIRILNNFNSESAYNSSDIEEKTKNYVQEQVTEVGGVNKIFFSFDNSFIEMSLAKLNDLIEKEKETFNEDEKAVLRVFANKYFAKLLQQLQAQEVSMWAKFFGEETATFKPLQLTESPLTSELSANYFHFLENVLTLRSQDFVKGNKKMPRFTYTYKQRLEALKGFSPANAPLNWGYNERDEFLAKMKNFYEELLKNQDTKTLDSDSQLWLLENQSLLKTLNS